MEPLLLICGGCGVKIRAADPDRARTRDCPRCATPLALAVAEALQINLDRGVEPPSSARATLDAVSAETLRISQQFSASTTPPRRRARFLAAAAALLAGSSFVHLAGSFPVGSPGDAGLVKSPPSARTTVIPAPCPQPHLPPLLPRADRVGGPSAVEPAEMADPEALGSMVEADMPSPVAGSVGDDSPQLAIRDAETPPSTPIPVPSIPQQPPVAYLPVRPPAGPQVSNSPGVLGSDEAPQGNQAPTTPEPRRLLVRDAEGKAVVAREHGMMKDQMAVVLPDGTIGWPTTQVFTDEPFVPSTLDEMERTLQEGEYKTFRVVKTKHYLVFYQSSERFARDSADLLEDLFDKLTGALQRQKLPVTPAEFPLIAVIFRSEDDFRANRKVPSEVQAYYEILSNRIFFYEKGKRDSTSPEVSMLRKPQTVAHEGTHQLLHNVGIQRRMSPWPLWLVEGFAEYCSPPKPTKQGVNWAGLGQINPLHLTTIRDLDDPMSSTVRGGPKAPTGRDRSRPLVEYLVTESDLTPTDYALSWGLTHYLARERLDQFVAYIRKLNRLLPFETRTPEEQLADFREAFGENLVKLEAQVGKHLAKLKIPDSQVLPYYAVLIEQPVSPSAVRRMAMVSQSPSVIRQWVETASNASNGQINWQALPHPTRTRAVLAADGWINHGR